MPWLQNSTEILIRPISPVDAVYGRVPEWVRWCAVGESQEARMSVCGHSKSLLLSVTIKQSSMWSPHSATLMLAPRTKGSELTVISVLSTSIYDASPGPTRTCPELWKRSVWARRAGTHQAPLDPPTLSDVKRRGLPGSTTCLLTKPLKSALVYYS